MIKEMQPLLWRGAEKLFTGYNDAVCQGQTSLDYIRGDVSLEQYQQSATVMGTALAAITVGIVIILGIFVFSSVNDAIPTITDANLNAARTNTVSNVGSGFELGGIVPLVLFAALILGAILAFGAGGDGKGM